MYSPHDKETMILAAKARNKSRLKELIDYARLSGYRRLGIANCKSVMPLAERLAEILKAEGFEVRLIDCKESGLEAQTLSPELSGPSCDPVAQAEYLNAMETELNINIGLCLGHGILFQQHSRAPVTTFLVKDFETGHKTIENLKND